MHTLLTYIVLLLSLLMFVVKREHKICLLIIDILCFNSVSFPVFGNVLSPYMFFFLSELMHYKQYYITIKNTRIKYPFWILLASMAILTATSPHLSTMSDIGYFFLREFIVKYGMFFLIFVACLNIKSQRQIITTTLSCLIVMTFFGLLNLVTRHAIYVDWALAGSGDNSYYSDAGSIYTFDQRFRVQSMFPNPFNYGYVCLMLLLYYWYLIKEKYIKKNIFYIAIACCLFGIFTCGCRTLLACLIVGVLTFVLFGYNLKSKVKFIISGLFLLFVVSMMMPNNFNKQISFLTSAFTDDQNVGGSSLSMRQTQTATVFYYIKDDIALGRGYGFFSNDLGWSGGRETAVDKDLQGLEGVYLNLLLERGIIGLALYALYWISIIMIVRKLYKKNRDKNTLAINASVIASYLAFANMTGELNSVPITLYFIGLSLAWSYSGKGLKELDLRGKVNTRHQ